MAVARTVLVAAVLCAAVALSEAGPRVAPEADVAFEYSTTGWRDVGPAHASDSVQVTIALKQRDVDGLRHVLDVVSDPRSAWYGNYLSQDQVRGGSWRALCGGTHLSHCSACSGGWHPLFARVGHRLPLPRRALTHFLPRAPMANR